MQDDLSSERRLVKRCLAQQRAAWQSFFHSYLHTIRESVLKHLGSGPRQADLAEEVAQHVCVMLLSEPRILKTFLDQELCIRSFLTKFAYTTVRRNYQHLRRHRTMTMLSPENLPEGVHLDWLDIASLRELADRLSPTLGNYLRDFLEKFLKPEATRPYRANGSERIKRKPMSTRERQMKHRLLQALQVFCRNQ